MHRPWVICRPHQQSRPRECGGVARPPSAVGSIVVDCPRGSILFLLLIGIAVRPRLHRRCGPRDCSRDAAEGRSGMPREPPAPLAPRRLGGSYCGALDAKVASAACSDPPSCRIPTSIRLPNGVRRGQSSGSVSTTAWIAMRSTDQRRGAIPQVFRHERDVGSSRMDRPSDGSRSGFATSSPRCAHRLFPIR